MPAYSAIPSGDVDPDSPLTTGLVTKLRDNPLAQAEDAVGSPDINGLDPLSEIVLSNDAIAVFDDNIITSAHDIYEFIFVDIVPVSDGVNLRARFSIDNGSSYLTTNYLHVSVNHESFRMNGAAESNNHGSASGEGCSGSCRLWNPASTDQRKRADASIQQTKSDGNAFGGFDVSAEHTGLAAINTIKFFFTAGNLNTGIIRCYGRRT